MQKNLPVLTAILIALSCSFPVLAAKPKPAAESAGSQIERGRYLVKISGCNDCHTSGYAESGGRVPEPQWLTGDRLGWRGPWGTTYSTNLRLYLQNLSEDQWVTTAKNLATRPPMPWFGLREMADKDLRAIYKFIRHLGPAGDPAPAFIPANGDPQQPYVQFPMPPK
jgi:mono/diheme cytochrome c family protein